MQIFTVAYLKRKGYSYLGVFRTLANNYDGAFLGVTDKNFQPGAIFALLPKFIH